MVSEGGRVLLGNYHTHSKYDDGKGELEEYVLAAIAKGFTHLGFSGHAPMAVAADWLMSEEGLKGYVRDFRHIEPLYRDRISLLLGLEVDYLPGKSAPGDARFAGLGLDYVVGSVHYLVTPPAGEEGWAVDGSAQDLDRGVREDFGGDIRALARAYYRSVAEMARHATPDIIGHFDVVKKNNRGETRFSESAPWYRELALEALDAVAASGAVLEINTGGITRGKTDSVYPSAFILERCRELGIRIMVNADAHRPEHIDGEFPAAFELMRSLGFRSRWLKTKRGWAEQAL